MVGGLMYLLDSNIFLELLLDQDKADEIERLLQTMRRERLHISDFSLYSVGIVLFRRNLFETFVQFVDDLKSPVVCVCSGSRYRIWRL